MTRTLDHIGDRVRKLVYLDAYVRSDGDTVASLSGRDHPTVLTLGADCVVPPRERTHDDPEARWQTQRRAPHPVRCFTEPGRRRTRLEDESIGLTYVNSTGDGRDAPGGNAFWDAAGRAEGSDRCHEIATNQMAPSNRPAELVAVRAMLA